MKLYAKEIIMEKMVKVVETLLKEGERYSSMYMTLALIGTCSRKEHPECKEDNESYRKWLENYFNPILERKYGKSIPPITIYKLRCSILHESSTTLDTSTKSDPQKTNDFARIQILETGSHFNFSTIKFINKKNEYEEFSEIFLDAKLFIEDLLEAIKTWIAEAEKKGINTVNDFKILNERWSSTEINSMCGFKECY